MYKIGIDLGASHIGIGIVDKNSKLVNKRSILFKNKIDKGELLKIIKENIFKLLNEINVKIDKINCIGLGMPGGINKDEKIFYGSFYYMLNIDKFNVKDELSKIFNKDDILIENDCNCAMLCEASLGSLKNFNNAIMFTIGTGLGISTMRRYNSKIILGNEDEVKRINDINDRKYIKSFKRLAWWYKEEKEKFCKLGHENNSKKINFTKLTQEDGGKSNVANFKREEIFDDYINKDTIAKDMLYYYLDIMIEGLNIISNNLEIYNICIGGGFSEYSKYYINYLNERLPNLNITVSKFKNNSAIIGAALLNENLYL